MLTLEIDGFNEIDHLVKEQLKQAGFNSIKDIVIRGPVQVAKIAEIEIEEASSICNRASLLLEQLGVIPNNISEASNNRLSLNKEYIKTGSAELDILFGNKGIETGAVTEFYGPSGRGKTQVCHTLCVTVQQLHPDNKAIYIDTEGKFRPERIAQVAKEKGRDYRKVLSNIRSARTLNSSRLETILRQECSSHIAKERNMKLLVVDSITSHYRAEYAGYSMLSQRQHQLNKIMNLLQNMAQAHLEFNYVVLIRTV